MTGRKKDPSTQHSSAFIWSSAAYLGLGRSGSKLCRPAHMFFPLQLPSGPNWGSQDVLCDRQSGNVIWVWPGVSSQFDRPGSVFSPSSSCTYCHRRTDPPIFVILWLALTHEQDLLGGQSTLFQLKTMDSNLEVPTLILTMSHSATNLPSKHWNSQLDMEQMC